MDEKPISLSRYQRKTLWYLSQGYTVAETAEAMDVARQSVTDSLSHTRRKLGARTHAQAVLLAYLGGHIGQYADCGSRETYVRHRARDEDACPACLRANREWVLNGGRTGRDPVPLTEEQVRLVRALHVGRTQPQLRALWGVSKGTMQRAVTALYTALGVAEYPREVRRERALEVAMQQGYLSPAARPLPYPALPATGAKLSPAEQRVLAAVEGRTLTETGRFLGMQRTTVSSHLNRVYRKLGVAHLPRKEKREAALKEARNQGYAL